MKIFKDERESGKIVSKEIEEITLQKNMKEKGPEQLQICIFGFIS